MLLHPTWDWLVKSTGSMSNAALISLGCTPAWMAASPPPMLCPATPSGALENMPAQRPPYCVLVAALRHLQQRWRAAA